MGLGLPFDAVAAIRDINNSQEIHCFACERMLDLAPLSSSGVNIFFEAFLSGGATTPQYCADRCGYAKQQPACNKRVSGHGRSIPIAVAWFQHSERPDK
jgi:hypothetical protein